MKAAKDLRHGDVIVFDGVEFIVEATAETQNGMVTILFKDMPATATNINALTALTKAAGAIKKEETK